MSTYLYWQGSDEEMELLSHWCMVGWDTMAVSQAGYKEQLFPQEGGQAVEEVIWKSVDAGGFQELPGKRLEQPGLISQVTLVWAGG